MFIGHYGVALAAKRVAPRTSLGALFVAVQLLDVIFCVLVFAGIEKLRIVPGFTQVTPYDLMLVSYSHSLAGAVLWAAAAALAFGLAGAGVGDEKGAKAKKARVVAALVLGGAVLSHFLLDYPMHVPDLPLGFEPDSPKVGLGLWNQIDVTLALEIGILVAGGALYVGATSPREGKSGATLLVGGVLLVIAAATPFVPPPADATAFIWQALGAYVVLALAAEWMDRSRERAA